MQKHYLEGVMVQSGRHYHPHHYCHLNLCFLGVGGCSGGGGGGCWSEAAVVVILNA
jgi:hypothetical protein